MILQVTTLHPQTQQMFSTGMHVEEDNMYFCMDIDSSEKRPTQQKVERQGKGDKISNMYNNFDLDEISDLHLDPPSSEDPPPCRIIQEGKDSILTTDFYLTNIEPWPWILPTPPPNKDTPKPSGAAAADKFTPVIEPDPVQPREIRLHSWMLYAPQTPVLDLREETITSDLDLRDTFH